VGFFVCFYGRFLVRIISAVAIAIAMIIAVVEIAKYILVGGYSN
jgi:hypothetical protein